LAGFGVKYMQLQVYSAKIPPALNKGLVIQVVKFGLILAFSQGFSSGPNSRLELSHGPAIKIMIFHICSVFIFLPHSICTYTQALQLLEHNENKTQGSRGEGSRGQRWVEEVGEQRKEVIEQRQEGLRKFFITKTERT